MSAPPLSMASHSAASLSRAAHSSICQPRLSCSTSTDIQVSSKLTFNQCCGSEIFHPGSHIKNDSGSRIRIHTKEYTYFKPKQLFLSSRKYDTGCSSRIRILIFTHPDPGSRVKKAPDPGSGSATLTLTRAKELDVLYLFLLYPVP
jgi:hypothetical protein